MLWTIASILLVVWIIGLAFHVFGMYIHIFLALAIATVLLNYIRGSAA